jgi:hypothetical protein
VIQYDAVPELWNLNVTGQGWNIRDVAFCDLVQLIVRWDGGTRVPNRILWAFGWKVVI